MMPATALMMACVTRPPNRPLAGALKKLLLWAPLVLAGYSAVMLLNLRGAGEKLASIKPFSEQVNERWQRQYHQPVRFVGGDYLSQWLTFYIDDRPAVITPWSVYRRPNIYTLTLRQDRLLHDGVLLCWGREARTAAKRISAKYWRPGRHYPSVIARRCFCAPSRRLRRSDLSGVCAADDAGMISPRRTRTYRGEEML